LERETALAQMAKNRSDCLFRPPFLWSLSFGGAKESDRKKVTEKTDRKKLTEKGNFNP